MAQLLRKTILFRDWLLLGHLPESFNAVACSQHQWELADKNQRWNIQALENKTTGKTEYWISQKCRCKCCKTVRNFPLVEIIFKFDAYENLGKIS